MAQNELGSKHGKRRLLQGRRIENHQTLRLSSPSNTGALPMKPQALAMSDINSVSSPTLGLPFDIRTHDSFKTREFEEQLPVQPYNSSIPIKKPHHRKIVSAKASFRRRAPNAAMAKKPKGVDIEEIQKSIKTQFIEDNEHYLNSLLSQKDAERFYVARAEDLPAKASNAGVVEKKQPQNLSEIIKLSLTRQHNLPDLYIDQDCRRSNDERERGTQNRKSHLRAQNAHYTPDVQQVRSLKSGKASRPWSAAQPISR